MREMTEASDYAKRMTELCKAPVTLAKDNEASGNDGFSDAADSTANQA